MCGGVGGPDGRPSTVDRRPPTRTTCRRQRRMHRAEMPQDWTTGNGDTLPWGGGKRGYPLWFPWCSLLALLGYLTCQTGTSDSAVLRMIARSWLLSAWYSL